MRRIAQDGQRSPRIASRRRAAVAGATTAVGVALLAWLLVASGPDQSARAARSPVPDASTSRARRATQPNTAPAWGVSAAAPPVEVGSASPPALDATRGCALSGRVVSAVSGAAVPHAQLTFSRSGEANSVDGGDDGAFCFQPGQPGRWTLAMATAPGFLPFAPEWGYSPVQVDVRERAHVAGVVVTLVPEERYTGRVVDPDGHPVAGAEVRVIAAGSGETAGMPLPARFVSGDDGTFSFTARDGAELEAWHPAYGPGRARLELGARLSRQVTVTLTPPGYALEESLSISGHVDDPDGHPAEGALVVAYSQRNDREEAPRQATADASGRFDVQDLSLGAWRVVASQGGFAPAVAESVRAGTSGVALRLRAGGRLRGTVRDRGGGPVASFTVRLRWKGRDRLLPPRTVAVVDAGGGYEVAGVPPGPALVSVSAPGRSPSPEVETAVPEPGAPPALGDFELAPGARVTGVVLDAATGAPLAGAQVKVDGRDAGPSALPSDGSATSAPDGRFALDGVPAGRPLTVYAQADGHDARVVSGVEAPEGGESAPLAISLPPVAPGEDPRVEVNGLGAILAAQGSGLRVMSVSDRSAAAEAGLGPGDEVVRIEGKPVAELSLDRALKLMRDAEGEAIVLAVRKAGDAAHAEQRVVVAPALRGR